MITICFILLLLISILTPSYGQCASGWVEYSGNCYLFNPVFNSGSTSGTWLQCNAYCTTSSIPGATMLCIRNAAEMSWIVPQSQYGDNWIGYTDMLPYGGGKGTKQFGWVTGCSSTYSNWAPGQPDNGGNLLDNAALFSWNGYWQDETSRSGTSCGCQYKLAQTTSSGPTSSPTTTPTSGVVTE